MLFDTARHQPLTTTPWDAGAAHAAIRRIIARAEKAWSLAEWWPLHPLDREGSEQPGQIETPLYHGATGVVWALHYLESIGACRLQRDYTAHLDALLACHARWPLASAMPASYLLGELPIQMLRHDLAALLQLISSNVAHPARELMCGAPGTALAALFLHERTGDARWAELFRASADALWTQLEWSDEHGCAFWRQHLFGHDYAYLDAVHGFVSVAPVLLRGRHLLQPSQWSAWQACIENTVQRTASREGELVNWRPQLTLTPDAKKLLLQLCHGAPGFVVCLGDWPGSNLDELLVAAARTTWEAGPLAKGPNLCHGTAGNGYALLKMARRTGNAQWLDRARRFAMHAIEQVEQAAAAHGDGRHALWTGDLGVAIYLWDCIHGAPAFPTLDTWGAVPVAA